MKINQRFLNSMLFPNFPNNLDKKLLNVLKTHQKKREAESMASDQECLLKKGKR